MRHLVVSREAHRDGQRTLSPARSRLLRARGQGVKTRATSGGLLRASMACVALSGTALIAHDAPVDLPGLLPEAEEVQAALEGAPAHLRKGAGVYVLKSTGYVRVRESSNGFTCLVNREFEQSFEPECFDAEGSETVLPVRLYRAELRAAGKSPEDVDRAVGEGFLSGRFRAPRRVGICYMLSTRNVVVLDRKSRKVGPVPPHLMFYAPYLRNADLGATPDMAAHFIVADEGMPTALIIVPVGSDGSEHSH